jgi:hypothetical protein
MLLDLDFTGVESLAKPEYTPIPEDEYLLILEGIEVKPSKANSANLVAHCNYTVSGGDYDGRKLMAWQVVGNTSGGLSEEQKGYVKYWLECLMGSEIDGSVSIDLSDLVGASVTAKVRIIDRNDGKKDANGEIMKQNDIHYFINPLQA